MVDDHRVTLGSFLRRRREQTPPELVGLRSIGQRRTPGLRREELALLAGISVDYLVRLEQNRDRHPSSSVLAALSDALGLEEPERRRLFRLATVEDRRAMCPVNGVAPTPLRPATLQLLDALAATPGFVLEPAGDLPAWNDALSVVMQSTGLLDGAPPNVVQHVFDVSARPLYPAWDALAGALVSHLQSAATSCTVDHRFEAVVHELRSKHCEFDALWRRHQAVELEATDVLLAHPQAGELAFAAEVMALSGLPERWLVALVPADATTAKRVDRLVTQAAVSIAEEPEDVVVAGA